MSAFITQAFLLPEGFPQMSSAPRFQLGDRSLTPTNYGICATVNGKIMVKAPNWTYIPTIALPCSEVLRSYTPRLQGDIPTVVLEFLSDTDGSEYSVKETYPPGKFF